MVECLIWVAVVSGLFAVAFFLEWLVDVITGWPFEH